MQHPGNGTRSRSLIIVRWPWTGRRSDRSHEYCGCRAVSGPRIYPWTSRTGSGRSSGTPSTLIDNWMCVVRHSRDYRVSRPETRSADHLEPEPNFTSRGVYDFRIQKGHRTGRGGLRARQTLDKDVSRLDYHTKFRSGLTVLTKLLRSIYFRYIFELEFKSIYFTKGR